MRAPISLADTPFLSARRKIERANHHIKEVQSQIVAFLATDFHHPVVEKDPETGNLRLNFWHPGPHAMPGFGATIGDAVHNLRCALDHTISEIVRMCGGNDVNVHFPMHETREELKKSIDHGLKKKIGPELCSFIIETIKPYRCGNYPLWALNKLDNLDKHRMILVTNYTVTIGVYTVDKDSLLGPFPENHFCIMTDGSAVPDGGPAYLHNQAYANPAMDICFDERHFFQDEPVIPTLEQLSELVSGVVETLAAHFLASQS
jgi:hypothetical protein